MFCDNCGQALPDSSLMCKSCGQSFAATADTDILATSATLVRADKGIRVAGYLIDVIPAALLGLFSLIPVVGPMIVGLLLTPYWLLRDVGGASLEKLVLRTRIVRENGQPAGAGARVLRNLPLAIGPAFLIIPLLGYVLGPGITGLIVLVEAVMLLTQGYRVGDRLAGTIVIKK